MRIALLQPWLWAHKLPRAVGAETIQLVARLWRARHTLIAVSRVDFRKKYSGSTLGLLWYPLYAALLLGMYCFIYMVIFPVRFSSAGFGGYDKVLFIFSGLVPYLGFSEAVSSGAGSIKGNIVLVKNTVFPIELIPVKHVLVSIAGLSISLALVLLMIAPTRHFGWHLLYLPVPVVLLTLFSLATVWILSAVAVLIPDINYVVNLVLLFFLFVSPIGYEWSQVPPGALAFVYGNPMTYLIDSFRYALIGMRELPLWSDLAFLGTAVAGAALGGSFFRRLMPLFSDHE